MRKHKAYIFYQKYPDLQFKNNPLKQLVINPIG